MRTPVGIMLAILVGGGAAVLELFTLIALGLGAIVDPVIHWILFGLWSFAAVVIIVDSNIDLFAPIANPAPLHPNQTICPACLGHCGFVLHCTFYAYFLPCIVCNGIGTVTPDTGSRI